MIPEDLAALFADTPSTAALAGHIETLQQEFDVAIWTLWPPVETYLNEDQGHGGVVVIRRENQAHFSHGPEDDEQALAMALPARHGHGRTIFLHSRPDRSLEAYWVVLHEFGHIATGNEDTVRGNEEAAWRWAQERSLVPIPEEFIEKSLRWYREKYTANETEYKHSIFDKEEQAS